MKEGTLFRVEGTYAADGMRFKLLADYRCRPALAANGYSLWRGSKATAVVLAGILADLDGVGDVSVVPTVVG